MLNVLHKPAKVPDSHAVASSSIVAAHSRGNLSALRALLGIFCIVALPVFAAPAQNSPVITSVSASGAATMIGGNFNSTPNTTFQLAFYDSPVNTGGGNVYLGSTSVKTDGTGNTLFRVSLASAIPANSFVSATATDPANNTSGFSPGMQFVPVNPVNLYLRVSATPAAVQYNNQLAFDITVSNSATVAASGVVVSDTLPAALGYNYADPSQGSTSAAGNIVTWNVGALPAGGTATMSVYATAQTPGSFTNVATLTQNEFNLNFAASTNLLAGSVYAQAPLTVTTQPAPQLLNLGAVLNLVVGVLGANGPLHYQWRLNGANIPGATNATYSKAGLISLDGGLYTCVISDQNSATTTDGALITLGGLLPLPASDSFALRGPLLNLLNLMSFNNVNATSEPGEPLHAGVPGGKSVWFTWTPLLSGVATVTTAGSSFDTLLAVYTGNNISNLTEVASDDDDGGYYTSTVKFNAVGGTTYSIAVDGAYGASGQIMLNATENILAPALPVITSQPTSQAVGFGATAQFAVSTASSGISYQWYLNGAAIANATGSSLLVKNASAANVGLYTVKLTKGSASVISKAASLQISTLDGSLNTNGIARDKYQNAFLAVSNAGQSQVQAPQSLSKAGVKSSGGTSRGYSSTQVFTAYGSATQTGEPNHCGTSGGDSTWTTIQAADNGVMTVDTSGTTFQTVLGVYTGSGSDFSSLAPVACDVNGGQGGTNSQVSFAATSNTVYYVAVDGVYGQSGTVTLHANLAVPPTIASQPLSQTASPGATVTLTATATGHVTPTTQWWHNGVRMNGATNGTLTISNFQAGMAGTYAMSATNTVGTAVTTPVTLLLNSQMHMDSFGFNRSNHTCTMRLVGTANTSYIIQTSTNMINWVPVATNTPSSGLWTYNDTYATNGQRFYRAIPGH